MAVQVYTNLKFMEPLIDEMVRDEPEKRPTIDEVATSFKAISSKLSSFTLRARLVEKKHGVVSNIVRDIYHISSRTVPEIVLRRPAIPTPK